jgi:hypothetical protein
MSKRASKKLNSSPPAGSSPEPLQCQEGTAGGGDAAKTGAPKKPRTIFSELWPQPEDIGGLFQLYRNADGVPVRVELGSLLTQRSDSLYRKLDEHENALAHALAMAVLFEDEKLLEITELPEPKIIFPFGTNVHEIHGAAIDLRAKFQLLKIVSTKIAQALSKDVEIMTDSNAADKDRKEARNRAEKTFSNALDGLYMKSRRKAHKSAAKVRVAFEDGEPRDMLLAWVALQVARDLVFFNVILQKEPALPTKGQIQTEIEKRFPETRVYSKSAWRSVWSDAGLSKLKQSQPWSKNL